MGDAATRHTMSEQAQPAHASKLFVVYAADDANFVRDYLLPALNLPPSRVRLNDPFRCLRRAPGHYVDAVTITPHTATWTQRGKFSCRGSLPCISDDHAPEQRRSLRSCSCNREH